MRRDVSAPVSDKLIPGRLRLPLASASRVSLVTERACVRLCVFVCVRYASLPTWHQALAAAVASLQTYTCIFVGLCCRPFVVTAVRFNDLKPNQQRMLSVARVDITRSKPILCLRSRLMIDADEVMPSGPIATPPDSRSGGTGSSLGSGVQNSLSNGFVHIHSGLTSLSSIRGR